MGQAFGAQDETGIRVPAISPGQAVHGLARALYRLATDSALCGRMGAAGRQRVGCHFAWDEKGLFSARIYDEVWAA